MDERVRGRIFGWIGLTGIALLVAVGLWKTRGSLPERMAFSSHPEGIMGTECSLTAVVSADNRAKRAERALQDAEAALRRVDVLMSTYMNNSEISRFNAASAGETVPMSQQTLEVLRTARAFVLQTDGAFDVTCRPLIQLWKRAGKQGVLPTPEELSQARAMSSWDDIRLLETGAVKSVSSARIDLGGIAKGYAIDRAIDAMVAAGCSGGLVNVGGDLRCFGGKSDTTGYEIDINSPFESRIWTTIKIRNGAVCTSGNYARFVTIAGRRYSHITDPRTGMPADAVPSVTVIAPTAVVADAWATTLSVLGPSGLKLLSGSGGIDAMIVAGTSQDYRIHTTKGFIEMLPPGFLAQQKKRLPSVN